MAATIRQRTAPAPPYYSWVRYASVTDDNASGKASLTVSLNTNGAVSYTTSIGDASTLDNDFPFWHDGGAVTGIGNSRWAKRTGGSGIVTGTLDATLVAMSSSRTLFIETLGELSSADVLIEIYSDSGGTTKVGEILLSLAAYPTPGGPIP